MHRTTPLLIIASLVGVACHLRMSPPPSSKSGLSPNRAFGLFFACTAHAMINIGLLASRRRFRAKVPRLKWVSRGDWVTSAWRNPGPQVVSACSGWVNSFRIQGFPQMPAEKVSGRACADREHDAPKRPITAVSSRTQQSAQGCRTGVGRIGRRLADGHQQAGSK